MDKYLPIGSIVEIKGVNKKVMIVGYYSIKYQNAVKMFDYFGYEYPEGMLELNGGHSFNHRDIVSVDFEGYKDESYNILNNNMNNQQKNNKNLKSNGNLINVKYDDNGVVVYKDLVTITPESKAYKILESFKVDNPFKQDTSQNYTNESQPDIQENYKNEITELPEVKINNINDYFVVE